MTNIEIMNKIHNESKNFNANEFYNFAHGVIAGKSVKANSFEVNKNTKVGVVQTRWYIDGKIVSRNKILELCK